MKSPFWDQTAALFDKRVAPENLRIDFMRSTLSNGGPIQPNETFKF